MLAAGARLLVRGGVSVVWRDQGNQRDIIAVPYVVALHAQVIVQVNAGEQI